MLAALAVSIQTVPGPASDPYPVASAVGIEPGKAVDSDTAADMAVDIAAGAGIANIGIDHTELALAAPSAFDFVPAESTPIDLADPAEELPFAIDLASSIRIAQLDSARVDSTQIAQVALVEPVVLRSAIQTGRQIPQESIQDQR